jgi:hypothetical protein
MILYHDWALETLTFKTAYEVVSLYKIESGEFDNVARCCYEVPDYWAIGEVYERLIEDICG